MAHKHLTHMHHCHAAASGLVLSHSYVRQSCPKFFLKQPFMFSDVFQVHLFGASLGGFLAQKFAEYTHKSPRVQSLILCNSFSDTAIFNQTWTANRYYSWFCLGISSHGSCLLFCLNSTASGWCQLSCWRRLYYGTLPKDLWTQKWQMQLTLWLTE